MKIKKTYQLEKVVSTEPSRRVINHVYVDKKGESTVAVATNGKAMAIVPVEIENESEVGYLTSEVLKDARKVSPKNNPLSEITLNGDQKLVNGATYQRPKTDDIGNYPAWHLVVPAPDRPITLKLSFNPFLLAKLASALGVEDGENFSGVTLEIQDGMAAIKVLPIDATNKAVGILMPIALKEEEKKAE